MGSTGARTSMNLDEEKSWVIIARSKSSSYTSRAYEHTFHLYSCNMNVVSHIRPLPPPPHNKHRTSILHCHIFSMGVWKHLPSQHRRRFFIIAWAKKKLHRWAYVLGIEINFSSKRLWRKRRLQTGFWGIKIHQSILLSCCYIISTAVRNWTPISWRHNLKLYMTIDNYSPSI